MPSQLIQKMLEQYAYPVLNSSTIDEFLASQNEVVLFFTENPGQFPESDDVAMILPELVKAFKGRFQAAVIEQASERELQGRYGFKCWPALVFVRQGQYLGVITGVQNWDDYLNEINRILDSEAAGMPVFKIPVISEAVKH